jgi:hypothetical protein
MPPGSGLCLEAAASVYAKIDRDATRMSDGKGLNRAIFWAVISSITVTVLVIVAFVGAFFAIRRAGLPFSL